MRGGSYSFVQLVNAPGLSPFFGEPSGDPILLRATHEAVFLRAAELRASRTGSGQKKRGQRQGCDGFVRSANAVFPFRAISWQFQNRNVAHWHKENPQHRRRGHAPKGLPAPARGWITATQARNDGIWGRVEWTGTTLFPTKFPTFAFVLF
ncbi:phage protease [Pseudophaeobacter sp. MA21411-1]|nr:phage protease [Pseudophaeobacter flagellatus]MCD9150122.1 phage protease [Pseudophaeobacter flagellatus]